MWLLLVVSIVHSSAPFGGPIGTHHRKFSDLFYSDPRRLSAVVTMLLAPMAGIALFTLAAGVAMAALRRLTASAADRHGRGTRRRPSSLIAVTIGLRLALLPAAPATCSARSTTR